MRTLRTRSISTKVTEEEYAQLSSLASTRTMSEWARDVLLAAIAPPATPILLAELLALRTIVINVQFASAIGDPLTREAMQQLMARADEEKLRRALERLAPPPARSPRP